MPQITDTKSPIIIVVGPASSGKSMIMVRIAKYLSENGYTVAPEYNYMNTQQYVVSCKMFDDCLKSNLAMPGTVTDLLVKIKDKDGNTVAQYLEAPGEEYFDPQNPGRQPAQYLLNICGGGVPNKKIFIYVLDLDSSKQLSLRSNPVPRGSYANRLINVISPLAKKGRDKRILLYNKLDLTSFGTIHEIRNKNGAEGEARQYYGSVFSGLTKKILGGFISYEDFKFMVFSTGSFSNAKDDEGNDIQKYTISDDVYPKLLWNEIMRKL